MYKAHTIVSAKDMANFHRNKIQMEEFATNEKEIERLRLRNQQIFCQINKIELLYLHVDLFEDKKTKVVEIEIWENKERLRLLGHGFVDPDDKSETIYHDFVSGATIGTKEDIIKDIKMFQNVAKLFFELAERIDDVIPIFKTL